MLKLIGHSFAFDFFFFTEGFLSFVRIDHNMVPCSQFVLSSILFTNITSANKQQQQQQQQQQQHYQIQVKNEPENKIIEHQPSVKKRKLSNTLSNDKSL